MTQITPAQAATADALYNEGRALYARAQTAAAPERERLLGKERQKYESALGVVGITVDTLRLPLSQRLANGAPPATPLTRLPLPLQNAAYNLSRRYQQAAYEALARPDLTRPELDAARRGLEISLGISDALVRGPSGETIHDPMAHVEFAGALTNLVRLRVREGDVGWLEARAGQAPNPTISVRSANLAALAFARGSLMTAAQVNNAPIANRGLERMELLRQLHSSNTTLTMAHIDASRLIAEAATAATGISSPELSAFRNSTLAAMPRQTYALGWLQWFVQVNRPAYDGTTEPAVGVRYQAQFQALRQSVEQRLGPVQ